MLKSVCHASMIAGLSLALAGCGEAPAQSLERSVDVEAAHVATSILNAGVMVEFSGEAGAAKLLFDPLYDDHFGSLEQLTPELIEAIVTGAPPYDGVDAVFVTHAHGDHFSESMLTRMMREQPELELVAPGQALDQLRDFADWDAGFEDRVTVIRLENGEAAEALTLGSLTVEAFRSPHNGWPDRHAGTHNITFRVSTPVSEGRFARVMHLGDADPASEHFEPLREFLTSKRTGLAMVPFWFYREEGLAALIDERLNAETPVAMHVPVRVPQYLREGDLPYFSEVGEELEIPETE